jgi:hypothetical protein
VEWREVLILRKLSSSEASLPCKFILSDISEKEITSGDGYHIFEPTIVLEMDGKNVFDSLGIGGVKSAVIMHSRERLIQRTLELITDLSEKDEGSYEYWLLGTGFGFHVKRKNRVLDLFLRVDGHMGPTQGVSYPQTILAGTVSASEWVESIASLSRTLSDLFRRLDPLTYQDPRFQKQEESLSLLEKWLTLGRNL